MRVKIGVVFILALFAVCVTAWAAVTTGAGTIDIDTSKPVQRMDIDWTCDGSGDFVADVGPLYGTINRVVANHVTTLGPTTLYDLTVEDEDGVDLLSGTGANITTATARTVMACFMLDRETTATTIRPMVAGELTVTIENAGVSKSGTVRIYLKKD